MQVEALLMLVHRSPGSRRPILRWGGHRDGWGRPRSLWAQMNQRRDFSSPRPLCGKRVRSLREGEPSSAISVGEDRDHGCVSRDVTRWCGRRRLGRLVVEVSDAKMRRRGTGPRGRTPWFYRGDGCEKGNRPPRSPGLPRAPSRHAMGHAPAVPIFSHHKPRRTARLPQANPDSLPTRGSTGHKDLFSLFGPPKGPEARRPTQPRTGPRTTQNQGRKHY